LILHLKIIEILIPELLIKFTDIKPNSCPAPIKKPLEEASPIGNASSHPNAIIIGKEGVKKIPKINPTINIVSN
jgi:hypothetical protein